MPPENMVDFIPTGMWRFPSSIPAGRPLATGESDETESLLISGAFLDALGEPLDLLRLFDHWDRERVLAALRYFCLELLRQLVQLFGISTEFGPLPFFWSERFFRRWRRGLRLGWLALLRTSLPRSCSTEATCEAKGRDQFTERTIGPHLHRNQDSLPRATGWRLRRAFDFISEE